MTLFMFPGDDRDRSGVGSRLVGKVLYPVLTHRYRDIPDMVNAFCAYSSSKSQSSYIPYLYSYQPISR
jgi:hypothetical protein